MQSEVYIIDSLAFTIYVALTTNIYLFIVKKGYEIADNKRLRQKNRQRRFSVFAHTIKTD